MARIWSEPYDPYRHRNPMGSEVGTPPGIGRQQKHGALDPHRVCFVEVVGFTFEFHSVDQAQACLDFYRRKITPSSRVSAADIGSADHWEVQRWFERLPADLRRASKRNRVVAALQQAVESITSGAAT
jgi:hypothetical protein